MFIFCSHSIWFSDLSVRLRLPFWQVVLETERTRAIRLTENLIALYFYNNSNNVAILLPTRTTASWKLLVYTLFNDLRIIPTRSLQNNLNSICLRILARSISIICIVNKIQAIKNSVAILLPRYKIIIAEICNKINTLKW